MLSTDEQNISQSPLSNLAERLRERLTALGISEREAGRRAGFGLSYVGDVVHGRSREPSTPRLIKLAEVLDCDLDYLIGRQETPRRVATGAEPGRELRANNVQPQRLIDLFSSSSLSEDLWVRASTEAVDKVPVIPPLAHVNSAYAWSVSTPHMEPRYFIGEIIYLHPGLVPRAGDFVLARRKSGDVSVARLVGYEGAAVRLGYLANPETLLVPKTDIEHLHRIVGSAG